MRTHSFRGERLGRRTHLVAVLFALVLAAICVVLNGCSTDDSTPALPLFEDAGIVDGTTVLVDAQAMDGASEASTTDSGIAIAIVGPVTPLTAQNRRDFAAVVTGSPDTTVTWSVDDDAGDTITAGGEFSAPAAPGTYTIIATSHADAAVHATASIPVVAAPIATLTAPDLATAGATGLTASAPLQAYATYAWSITGGTITGGAATTSITFTAGGSGSIVITCVVTNAAGSTATGTANVVIVSSPVVSISAPGYATSGKTGLVASVPAQTSATYAWTIAGTGTAITSGDGTPSITFTSGSIAETIIVGCTITVGTTSVSGGADVVVVNPPNADITAPAAAAPGTIGLTASVPDQDGLTQSTYAWSISGGTITNGNGTSSIVFSADTAGTLVLTCTVTNAAGDSANASVNVVVTAAPTTPVISAPTQATAGATSLIASVPPQSGASYAWTISGGTITSSASSATIAFTAGAAPGTVALGVTVTNIAGLSNASANVTVVAAPIVSITAPSTANQDQTGLIASVPTQTGATYAWTITGGTITAGTGTSQITFSAGAAGTLTLSCTVTNSVGDSINGSTTVSVVGTTASLNITLSGNPTDAVVNVSGPNSYASVINASQNLTGLAAGSYSVTAGNVISSGLTYVPTVGGSPANLTAGAASAVTVSYVSHDEAPTLGAVSDQVVFVNSPSTVDFTVGDAEDDPGTLTVSANAATAGVLTSITFGGSGANRSMTLTPPNTAGETDVTLNVTDSQNVTTSTTFHVSVQLAVVTTNADTGAGSLRDIASRVTSGVTITFDPSLNGETIALASTISFPAGVTVQGPGANLLTVSQSSSSVDVFGTSGVAISGLTLSGGNNGIKDSSSSLVTIDRCSFQNQESNGISAPNIAVTSSTFLLTNHLQAVGVNVSASLTMTNCTVSGYYFGVDVNGSASAHLSHVTATNNSIDLDAYFATGPITVRNSLFASTWSIDADGSAVTSLDYNIVIGSTSTESGGSVTPAAHDQIITDAQLDPLGSYGGPTQTIRPQSTSPAVDVIPPASCVDASGNALTTDQRGEPRPSNINCDIGAFERQPTDG